MRRLINKSKSSPLGCQACEAALQAHYAAFGDYGQTGKITDYMMKVAGKKVRVEMRNCRESYVATAIIGKRELYRLPGQAV